MMFRHRRGRRRSSSSNDMQLFDKPDMGPLLDLTFLLLIAFMITMPLMEYGTSINPPEMNSDKLPEEKFKSVTITEKGTILLDKEIVNREQLLEQLKAARAADPKVQILLRADGTRQYNEVIELMALIRNGGFSDVVLVTQAEKRAK